MKRIIATIFAVLAVLFTSTGVASANILTEAEQSELSSQSSSALVGPWQTNNRNIHTGLTIGLCSDGTIDLAGLVNEPGMYGVSLNIFGNITPVMTAIEFMDGEIVNNRSDRFIPAIPHLPVTLVASKAPVAAYDDTVRAEFSQTVLLTVPAQGCHFQKVGF